LPTQLVKRSSVWLMDPESSEHADLADPDWNA